MEILTKNTKKNINTYNNTTFKADVKQSKHKRLSTVAIIIRFMVIYSQFVLIFYQLNVVEVNAELHKPKYYCAVVIDAGSTGSRVLAVAFDPTKSDYLKNHESIFHQIPFGLSQTGVNESKREEILKELLTEAIKFMNDKNTCGETPVLLRATAGLRLLPIEKSDEILNQVRTIFDIYKSVFQVNDDSVSIMKGDDEGLFGWLSVNILLGNLTNLDESVAVLDLGGGSLEITFRPTDDSEIPINTKYLREEYFIMGKKEKLYTHSFLDLGLGFAQTLVFKSVVESDTSIVTSPCYSKAKEINYSFNGVSYTVTGEDTTRSPKGHYESCRTAVLLIFDKFSVESISTLKQKILGIAFFYDVSLEDRLIVTGGGSVTVGRLDEAAKICYEQHDERKLFACFNLVYISTLLIHGFELPLDRLIDVEKTISEHVIGWALGAAYDVLRGKMENV